MISAQDCNIEKVLKTQSFSYLRPHPPYLAPEPYNTMYHPDDVPAGVVYSSVEEEKKQHPLFFDIKNDPGRNCTTWQLILTSAD